MPTRGARTVHELETMADRLSSFLSQADPAKGVAVCTDYEPMAGGYSRTMARAQVEWSESDAEVLVLRGDPPPGQALIETDRDAEWVVHRALTDIDGLSIPPARYYDATGEHLGTKCIVMDYCEGVSFQSFVEGRDDLADQALVLAQQLAPILTVDVAALPEAMQRPDPDTVIDALIDQWAEISDNHCNTSPVYRYVIKWLGLNKPPPMEPTLVHGDFQNPNIMIDDAASCSMIDWEFAHIGDPREDLGWYNLYSSVAGTNLYEANPAGFLDRYRALTGFDETVVNELTVGYFTIAGAAKVAQEVLHAIDGLASGEVQSTMAAHQAAGALTMGNGIYLQAISAMETALRATSGGAS